MTPRSDRPRCVAMMSPAWPPATAPNGIVAYTAAIKGALEREGVRVVVMAADNPAARGAGYYGIRDPGRMGQMWDRVRTRMFGGTWADQAGARLVALVRKIARREGAELIEMEESFGWCGDVAEGGGIPVVGRLHGPWFLNGAAVGADDGEGFDVRVERERVGILTCQGLTAPCRDVLDRTRRHYGIALDHAEVIPYPMDAAPEDDRWRPDRHEPGLITFIGRFDRHKAGDVMLDAFALLVRRRPQARLLFVGPDRGLTDDAGRVRTMPEFLERLPSDARDRVEWVGYQPHSKLAPLRRRAAVTVVCSRYENFGYAVLEGLSLGCPMVVTRVGGLVEMVEHERSALLCNPSDPADLAEQIERMLDDRTLAERLARQGLRNVVERFHPATIASRTLSYYRRVLQGQPARSAPGAAPAAPAMAAR